ncbi:hypothetical protein NDU88_004927 [Pleurodeles waltl]|uniref:Uncharacterized protein n=1 Tax=Pleurodeles waltl TaxID=8319 RepID=A0AAV7UGK4_PLEWA|nr:hypothetical protein NDU88_004927 [Pleurodeles waltl]
MLSTIRCDPVQVRPPGRGSLTLLHSTHSNPEGVTPCWNGQGTGPDKTVPHGDDQSNACRRQHARRDIPEKGREDGARREEKDVGEDAKGVFGESKTQEMEEEATSNAKEDADLADEWIAQGEQEGAHKSKTWKGTCLTTSEKMETRSAKKTKQQKRPQDPNFETQQPATPQEGRG